MTLCEVGTEFCVLTYANGEINYNTCQKHRVVNREFYKGSLNDQIWLCFCFNVAVSGLIGRTLPGLYRESRLILSWTVCSPVLKVRFLYYVECHTMNSSRCREASASLNVSNTLTLLLEDCLLSISRKVFGTLRRYRNKLAECLRVL